MSLHKFPKRVISTPIDGGGEPPDNEGMEITERVIRVEEKLVAVGDRLGLVEKDLRDLGKKLDAHFLTLAGMILAVAGGLGGMMAKGFHWF